MVASANIVFVDIAGLKTFFGPALFILAIFIEFIYTYFVSFSRTHLYLHYISILNSIHNAVIVTAYKGCVQFIALKVRSYISVIGKHNDGKKLTPLAPSRDRVDPTVREVARLRKPGVGFTVRPDSSGWEGSGREGRLGFIFIAWR